MAIDMTRNIGDAARSVGGTLGSKARDVGGVFGTKASEVGGALGGKARGLQGAAAPKARQVSKAVGRRTKDTRRKVGYWIAGEKPKNGRSAIAVAAATGAAAAFFLDPTHGKRRRRVAVDWTLARLRGAGRSTARLGRGVGARAEGLRQLTIRLGDHGDASDMNDPTLEQKVQSELFQGLDLPSKEISIMVSNGVVSLRGTVDRPDMIKTIEARVRRIDGIRDVENQLHPKNAPAPTTT